MSNKHMIAIGTKVYNFEEMMAVDYHGRRFPLRYDTEGHILDFFDWAGDQFWIDCGETITSAYREYVCELADKELLT